MSTPMYTYHPACLYYPEISPVELEEMANSIKREGQKLPILIDDLNRIIDGRNRYKACLSLGIVPRFEVIKDDAIATTIAMNIKRRKDTSLQRACIAVLAADSVKASRRRGRSGYTDKGGGQFEMLARMFATHMSSIAFARRVFNSDPTMFEELRCGRITDCSCRRKVLKRQVVCIKIEDVAYGASRRITIERPLDFTLENFMDRLNAAFPEPRAPSGTLLLNRDRIARIEKSRAFWESNRALLGTMTDGKLAAMFGVTKQCILQARARLGIPPFSSRGVSA